MPKQLTDEEARTRLAKNFNGTITALEPFKGSLEPWRVKCICGNEWSAYPGNLFRKNKPSGCSVCAHQAQALTDEQARTRLNPTFTPLEPYPGNQKRHWKVICERGHRSSPIAGDLTEGHGCRECSDQDSRLTDEEARRRLAENFNGTITALEPYKTNRERWRVKCLICGKEWGPYAPNLLQKNKLKGCQACYHRIHHALTDEQARGRLNPTFTPLEPYPGSGRRNWRVTCERGHRSSPKAAILTEGCGCRECFHQDLTLTDEEARARIFKRHNGTITPMEPYPGANDLAWKMKCECGHQWAQSLSHLGKWGCQKCARRRQSLTDEEARMRLFDYFGDKITALEAYPGSWERNWLVVCNQCGKQWSPTANSLLVGSGCPNCAEYGFQLAKPAITYYIRISTPCGYLYKIGVTNLTVKQRYRAESVKFDVVAIWSFRTGVEALELETEILQKNEAYRYEGPMIFRYCRNDEIFTRDVLGLDNLEELEL